MEMRAGFHKRLREIQEEVLAMGNMVAKAILLSIDALKDRDLAVAKKIGACLHGNRYHCWHVLREFPKSIVYECCRCHKRKRRYKPCMGNRTPKFISYH